MVEDQSCELLGVKETCALLKVSQRTLYRLRDSGRMPRPNKLGGKNVWQKSELAEWIRAGCPAVRQRAPGRIGQ